MNSPPASAPAPSFAALVQAFFTQHLVEQRAMSPRTVATYRDAFVLFLAFAQIAIHILDETKADKRNKQQQKRDQKQVRANTFSRRTGDRNRPW